MYRNAPNGFALAAPVDARDSTFIDLSVVPCLWTSWTNSDATVELHTMFDLRVALAVIASVTEGDLAHLLWLIA